MKSIEHIALIALASLTATAVGCSGDSGTSGSGENAPGAAKESPGTVVPETTGAVGSLLYSVNVTPTHVIEFRDLGHGALGVLETAPSNDRRVVLGAEDSTFAAAFHTAKPELEVPQVLLDADARAAGALTRLVAEKSPSSVAFAANSGGVGPRFYDQGNLNWFKTNICEPQRPSMCLAYWDWADTGVTSPGYAGGGGGHWTAWAEPGSEATERTNSASFPGAWFYGSFWTCTQWTTFNICTGHGWVSAFSSFVRAGWWQSWAVTNDGNANGQVTAHIGDNNVNATVSLALRGQAPAPPPPPPPPPPQGPSCTVLVRAHTTNCTNYWDGSPTNVISSCADGCGTSYSQAAASATASLSTVVCLGSSWGCCQVVTDQNFNYCGG